MLNKAKILTHYKLDSLDGEIGNVYDFIIDDQMWAIRYLIIDTRNWWPGEKVLISPQWIDRVNWSDSKVFVNLSRDAIKESPEYTKAFLLTRDYETRLHGHYHLRVFRLDRRAEDQGKNAGGNVIEYNRCQPDRKGGFMITLLSNLPDHVVGFVASGQVTATDYESVVIPAIESKLKKHGKVSILYHIGPAFSGFTAGAMWDDAKLGITHLKAWEKIAVVTDVDWIAGAVGIFRFAIPCQVKVFSNSQLADAAGWISA